MTSSVVFFCMQGLGHLQCLLPVVDELHRRGLVVHVLTGAEFQPAVERAGGRFIDLFARFPLDAVDSTSVPVPSRNVTFAGVYAEPIADEVAALSPGLIVHDTFAVIAPVVARRLGLPDVNVYPNHAAVPSRALASLHRDPRVHTSPECAEAVRRLREVHGMVRASPFSYVDELSELLNLYCEPREFLDPVDRAALAPLEFFGSLAPALRENDAPPLFDGGGARTRIYVSFGTVIWWYFAGAATAALRAIAKASDSLDAEIVVSLAGHLLAAETRAEIESDGVRIVDHCDQWQALREADVFVTHHGINSTHESIYHRVPMLSYPFFGDQPAMAQCCQRLGLALPLSAKPRAPLEAGTLRASLSRLAEERDVFASQLAEASSWERRTIGERPAIVDRIQRLIDRRP